MWLCWLWPPQHWRRPARLPAWGTILTNWDLRKNLNLPSTNSNGLVISPWSLMLCKKSCFAALSIWASEPATRASLIGNMEGKWLWREAMADRLLAQPRPCSKWSPARHLGECTFTRWDCQGDCRSYDSPHMDPGMRDSSRHDLQAKQPRWCGVLGQARSCISLVQPCIQNTYRSGSHLT